MELIVKIISPIKIDKTDLRRRQTRYSEQSGASTIVKVFNLVDGPETLSTPGDILFCEHAVFQEGMNTDPDEFDAILIDCAFDPALAALVEQSPIPTFGPMKATLAILSLLVSKFSFIARSERQIAWLTEVAQNYGHKNLVVSAHALGISYNESRNPKIFDRAMIKEIKASLQDGAEAVVLGSTTMSLDNKVKASAKNIPIFVPGLVALGSLELLWAENLLK